MIKIKKETRMTKVFNINDVFFITLDCNKLIIESSSFTNLSKYYNRDVYYETIIKSLLIEIENLFKIKEDNKNVK